MSGIVGIVGPGAPERYDRLVARMVRSMKRRPDERSGTYRCPEINAYGGWVAHPDSFSERQSAERGNHGLALLFCGEQFAEGADAALPEQAIVDGTNSLIDRYRVEGGEFVARMNGLFSGFLLDATAGRALLFNDRFGMERIYYCTTGEATFFASEAKALLSVLPDVRGLDDQGLAQFLAFGSTQGDRTLFRNIRLLPGGSLWTFEKGAIACKRQYFTPAQWETQAKLDTPEFNLRFERTFAGVLPAYLASREPLGISLTGGLDTRMIMACLTRGEGRAVCYTYAGPSGTTLDARIAGRVARTCGLEHHVLRLERDFLSSYAEHVDRTVFVTDGCAGALAAHEIYFSAQARKLSPIRLTGNFGSEILRSMSTLKPLGLAPGLISEEFRHKLTAELVESECDQMHPVTRAAFREIPTHLFGTVAAARSELTFRSPYLDNEIVKLAYQAPQSVRESTQSALSLIRHASPRLAAISTDRGLAAGDSVPVSAIKRLLSAVTFKLDYWYCDGLPHSLSAFDGLISSLSGIGLLGWHKFLPYRRWFREELAAHVKERVAAAEAHAFPCWDARFLRTVAEDHVRGRRNYTREIGVLLTLEAVNRVLLRDWPEGADDELVCGSV